jgi:hypothetical protein
MLGKRVTFHELHNVTCSCNQTVKTKHLYSDEKITCCCGQKKTPDHASVIAQKALMLPDSSQKKLLNSTNCQLLLSCAFLGGYGLFANLAA